MESNWPFEDPENTAVITVKSIIKMGKPVLLILHDEEGDWQFLNGEDVTMEDAMVVGLGEIIEHDRSVLTAADLPMGYRAWRQDANSPWMREKISD